MSDETWRRRGEQETTKIRPCELHVLCVLQDTCILPALLFFIEIRDYVKSVVHAPDWLD